MLSCTTANNDILNKNLIKFETIISNKNKLYEIKNKVNQTLMKKYLIAIISSITLVSNSFAQENQLLDLTQTPLYVDSMQLKWVDEKYNSLSLDEKVGQLFIVAAYSNRDATHEADILKLIQEEKIGGLIFMQDQAVKQIDLTNRYQATSKIPLMIGVDGEWGLAMRLKGVERFPWNMTMGALDNEDLVYKAGIQIGKQSNRMGIHFNFAPSVDVNVNPNNPIIGNRSYGSDPTNGALYFYNPSKTKSKWLFSLPVVATIGEHKFSLGEEEK